MQLLGLLRYLRRRQGSHARRSPAVSPLGLCKACNREDFTQSELRELVRTIFVHDRVRIGERFPEGCEDRLYWRTAMIAHTFAAHGLLRPTARLLGVGAGNEPALFWLTNRTGWVFAVDRYLEPGSRANTQCVTMLHDPDRHWPGSWNRRRLVVQHMKAEDLRFSDASFDGIFAVDALDSCREAHALERALEEMYRVLKPNGVLSLSLELRLQGGSSPTGRRLFDEQGILKILASGPPFKVLGPVDWTVSESTRQAARPLGAVDQAINENLHRHGQLLWHERPADYPSALALREGDVLSVPVHLALRKSGRSL